MTEQEILEGNKLIAEFMGWVNNPDNSGPFYTKGWGMVHPDHMDYHSSWDSLMPVVEKIEATYINRRKIQVMVVCTDCYISEISDEAICKSIGNNKLKSTFDCIVQFIKWYNTQSTQQ